MMVGQRFVSDSRNLQGIVLERRPIKKPGPKSAPNPETGHMGTQLLHPWQGTTAYAALGPGESRAGTDNLYCKTFHMLAQKF